jgi:hypothetical protein
MSAEEVRSDLGSPTKSFKRTSESLFPCDYFELLGVFAYYDATGRLEAVEFGGPAKPFFSGFDLLESSYEKLHRFLGAHDMELALTPDAITSNAIGVSAYFPDISENPAAKPQSVIAFRDNYFGFSHRS